MTPDKKLSKARGGLILDAPFFGSLALRLICVEDKTCDKTWTNGRYLGYNPDFIEGLTLDKVKGILIHAVMHLASGHQSRRQGRKSSKWNKACDYAIDPFIVKAGFSLPNQEHIHEGYDGLSAEKIFALLPDSDKSGDGQNPDGGQGDNDQPDPFGNGEVRDAPAESGGSSQPSQSDLDQSEQEWKVAAVQAASVAKACGRISANVHEFITTLLKPILNWKEVLREFIEKTSQTDYTWMVPNRRYLPYGFYLPSLASCNDLGTAVCAVDTSGSVSKKELEQFSSELSSILDEYPEIKLIVYYHDTQIKNHEEFTHDQLPIKLEAIGRGGTDYRPVFETIKLLDTEPKFLLMFTDMDCDKFPETTPEYPVLWISTVSESKPPPFGEIVTLAL